MVKGTNRIDNMLYRIKTNNKNEDSALYMDEPVQAIEWSGLFYEDIKALSNNLHTEVNVISYTFCYLKLKINVYYFVMF